MSSLLFTPYRLRGVTLRNRIAVSPMSQYSSEDGFAGEWHLVHLGSRAVGGAGLVLTEAAAVEPDGRISPQDLGAVEGRSTSSRWRASTRFMNEQGARGGHPAGACGAQGLDDTAVGGRGPRRTRSGWRGGPWRQARLPFASGYPEPEALDEAGIASGGPVLRRGHRASEGRGVPGGGAPRRAWLPAARVPLAADEPAPGPLRWLFDNRVRLVREVVGAVRARWPEELPLLVRISATDWVEGGWTAEDSVALTKLLAQDGADLIDCSTGGIAPGAKIPVGPGYQTAFAERIRREAGVPTGALGLIRSAFQAEHILRTEQADLVFLARELLRDPYWPLRAARELGAEVTWPPQYARARD